LKVLAGGGRGTYPCGKTGYAPISSEEDLLLRKCELLHGKRKAPAAAGAILPDQIESIGFIGS
jgi:hypothetical protein